MLSRPRRLFPLIIELAAITFIGVLYFLASVQHIPTTIPFTRLDPKPLEDILTNSTVRQTGLEHERLSGVLLPIQIGLERYRRIPSWNPYIGTGEPILNNAFTYLFNPFHSLPVLIWGGAQGTKAAMLLALLIAGYSMWTLGCALGLGAVARVTIAALYMMSGGIIGKYYAGHFQLALSLSWPPLVIAGVWWTMRGSSRFTPLLTGLAVALLFYAGNIYYVLHTAICAVLIVALHLFQLESGRWKLNRPRLIRAALAALFAFGLSALQFFPVWLARDYVEHNNQELRGDGSLQGSYSLNQAAENLTIPWATWQNFETESGPFVAVDYAYIGLMPFALIATAFAYYLLARLRPFSLASSSAVSTHYSALFFLLALLMMVWGSGQTPLLEWLYAHIPLLAEFRFVGRAHAIAALWWIVLAGIALDTLWKIGGTSVSVRRGILAALLIGTLVWLYLLAYSLSPVLTRLSLVLNNPVWVASLDRLRFTSFPQAVSVLWSLLFGAVIVQAIVSILWNIVRQRAIVAKLIFVRVLRTALVLAALLGIADILNANSPLIAFQPTLPGFEAIYADIHAQDKTPLPAVNETWSPLTFETYQSSIRNWGLNEGWQPLVQPTTLFTNPLPDLPRWTIVSNIYGSIGQGFAQDFVMRNGYTQRQCYALSFPAAPDPCQFDGTHLTAVLYEKPDALPYTFVTSQSQLGEPTALTAASVQPAQVTDYELDTMTIEANAPESGDPFYLVVQENAFPGWHATSDGQSIDPQTVPTNTEMTKLHGYLALPMQSGAHTYHLWFETPGWTPGLLVFILTLLGVAAYLLWPRLRITSP